MSEKKNKNRNIVEDAAIVGVGIFMIPLLPLAGIEVAYKFLKKRHKEKQLEWEIEEERERADRELWDSRMKKWRNDL